MKPPAAVRPSAVYLYVPCVPADGLRRFRVQDLATGEDKLVVGAVAIVGPIPSCGGGAALGVRGRVIDAEGALRWVKFADGQTALVCPEDDSQWERAA
jgi:hypothetical protein